MARERSELYRGTKDVFDEVFSSSLSTSLPSFSYWPFLVIGSAFIKVEEIYMASYDEKEKVLIICLKALPEDYYLEFNEQEAEEGWEKLKSFATPPLTNFKTKE